VFCLFLFKEISYADFLNRVEASQPARDANTRALAMQLTVGTANTSSQRNNFDSSI
jgi:hypothetical protein